MSRFTVESYTKIPGDYVSISWNVPEQKYFIKYRGQCLFKYDNYYRATMNVYAKFQEYFYAKFRDYFIISRKK